MSASHEIGVASAKPLLRWLSESDAPYCLVGGLAVGLLAEEFLSEAEKVSFDFPLHSKDIDFRGKRFLAEGIRSWLRDNGFEANQLVVAARKNAPGMGKIFNIPFTQGEAKGDAFFGGSIEVLERLPLLDDPQKERNRGRTIVVDGIRVLDPFALIICKLHAHKTRPSYEQGQDLQHILILEKCVISM